MNDVELTLAAMLAERAERVAPQPGRQTVTMHRARRRRLVNAILAGATSVAVVVGAVVGSRAVTSDGRVPPSGSERSGTTATTDGPYGFRSTTSSEYPYVARGWFRGGTWRLRAAAVELVPNADVRLTVQIDDLRRRFTSSVYVRDYEDPLVVRYEYGFWRAHENVAVVLGAVGRAAKSVIVSFEDREPIEAHVFTGHDPRTTLEAGYFLAFVPSSDPGEVVARDAEGRVIAREVIPPR